MNMTQKNESFTEIGHEPVNLEAVLISILIYNYSNQMLEQCLHSIFNQTQIINYEVIICDDATQNGEWDIALDYAEKHKGKVSLNRNRKPIGDKLNKEKGLLMCKGEFVVELTGQSEFNAIYALEVINRLCTDHFYKHFYIHKLKSHSIYQPLYNPIYKHSHEERTNIPLVSVCIYNYNYGRYLRQCIDSVLAQTYRNIEICFSDNASQDNSWDIAVDYAKKFPEKFNLSKNRINFGPNMNLWNCVVNMRGKYVLKLCSDDAITPDFIEKCIAAFFKHPDAGFVMVHRDIIDESGAVTHEPAFYNESCYIKGSEQAAVYMMSSINPSVSQIIYNVSLTQDKRMSGNLNDRWFGDRIMDFHICCDSPIIYIKEPLLLNRIHDLSDSSAMDSNLLQCVGEYVLLHQLSDIAGNYPGMEKSQNRMPEAIVKLSKLCLRYVLKRLFVNDFIGAKGYYHFALAINPDVANETLCTEIEQVWKTTGSDRDVLITKLKQNSSELISRKKSYKAPEGSIPL